MIAVFAVAGVAVTVWALAEFVEWYGTRGKASDETENLSQARD